MNFIGIKYKVLARLIGWYATKAHKAMDRHVAFAHGITKTLAGDALKASARGDMERSAYFLRKMVKMDHLNIELMMSWKDGCNNVIGDLLESNDKVLGMIDLAEMLIRGDEEE